MRTLLAFAAVMLAAVVLTGPAAADKVFATGGVAAGGYDVVSYLSGSPVKGSDAFTLEHKGVTWKFASADALAAFKADPAKYEPQYGGHCAYGLGSGGYLVRGDPKVWTIVDGKLYFNYSEGVRESWSENIPGYIASADSAWPSVGK